MSKPARKEFTELISFLHDQFIEKIIESREALDFSLESPLVYDYDFKKYLKSIQSYANETDHKIFSIIALQTPNTKDLRFLLGLYKSLSDLERVSKTILRISKISKHFDSKKILDLILLSSFEEMGSKLKVMFDKIIEILEINKLNIEKALELQKEFTESDDYVDNLFKDINKILIKKLENESNTKKQANFLAEVILVVRHMERIGDHLCDMAERTLYVETGQQFTIN